MLRRLLRSPGFALVISLTIGLVVGVNALIFSALNGFLLRDLPVMDPDRLVRAVAVTPRGETREEITRGDFDALSQASSHVAIAAFSSGPASAVEPGTRRTESVGVERISPSFFDVVGVELARGTGEVVISRRLEQSMFAGNALGRAIEIRGRRETVTGIARAPFRGTNTAAPADVWLPLDRDPTAMVRVIGRLRDGATAVDAQETLTRAIPDRKTIARVRVGPERAMLIQPGAPRSVTIALAVALMLMTLAALVASANVVGVLFARVAMRRRDLSIRVALGATPRTLVRETIAENMPLAIPAALIAWIVAVVGSRFFFARLPMQSRPAVDLTPDLRVAVFVVLLSTLAVLFAAALASVYARRATTAGLNARGGSERAPAMLRWLVAGQVALSIVALVAAALLLQTARAYHSIDPGFEYDKQLRLPVENVPLARMRDLAERLRVIDGVTHVAIARNTPLSRQTPMTFKGVDGEAIDAHATLVDGDYFALLGIPVDGSSRGVVVNEAMARRRPELVATGIARDARFSGLATEPGPFVFLPLTDDTPLPRAFLLLRTTRDPGAVIRDVNAVVAALGIPPATHRLADSVQADRWLAETTAALAGLIGGLTLLLAALGLFGVISASVSNRVRELAIRAALGASRASLAMLVARSSGALVLLGSVAGIVLSIPAARGLGSTLFGTDASDPRTWSAVAVILVLTSVAATALPARRAMTVSPTEILKEM